MLKLHIMEEGDDKGKPFLFGVLFNGDGDGCEV